MALEVLLLIAFQSFMLLAKITDHLFASLI